MMTNLWDEPSFDWPRYQDTYLVIETDARDMPTGAHMGLAAKNYPDAEAQSGYERCRTVKCGTITTPDEKWQLLVRDNGDGSFSWRAGGS